MEVEFESLISVEGKPLFEKAKAFYAQQEYIKALEVLEDLSFVKLKENNDKLMVSSLQGTIFKALHDETDNIDAKVTYLLASVEIFGRFNRLSSLAAFSLLDLAEHLESVLYYKKGLVKAKQIKVGVMKEHAKRRIEALGLKVAEWKTRVVRKSEERVSEETRESDSDLVKGLKLFWTCLNDEVKKSFMKISLAEFRSFVENVYGGEGRDALEEVLVSVKEDMKWRFWMCPTCLKKFDTVDDCKIHLEQEHRTVVRHLPGNAVVNMVSEALGEKLSVGGWEPVDAIAAVGMIKNQLEDVKAFVYENGWSKDWPLAADEERSRLLCEIQQLLVALYDRKVLSCSVLGCVMDSAIDYLQQLKVTEQTLTECFLTETPQSICFLECDELNEILDFLRSIKCERNDGFDLVCRAVESVCGNTRVKEKIDFDSQFSFLLLDKRLLKGKIAQYDDEGTISVFNPNAHYAKANVHGDDFIFWLTDNASGDETFRFPRPIRVHNLDIWVAVLKAILFTVKNLVAEYEKKLKLVYFNAGVDKVKNLCLLEDERRKYIPEDQWTLYATRICEKYDKIPPTDSLPKRIDFSAARQVLEAANDPTFDIPDSEEPLKHENVSDDSVLSSIEYLKLVVTDKISYKVPRIESKILLIENSRTILLNQLIRLSFFDYRSYILGPLKEFLLHGISDMESKAKIAAANAALLLEEEEEKKPEEKKPESKKKKNKNKKPSTSFSNPLDTIVENEPEHTVPSETGQLETSSNTDYQEEDVKRASELTNMAGESSQSNQLESTHGAAATRCKCALDMILKALCNIQVLKEYLVRHRDQFADNVQEQIPFALQSFFSAFASEEIKGALSCLLDDLHAYLESRDAAELLVSILEFWPCWRNPNVESVVTHLFTLEEYERRSCRKCRSERNFQKQSSYGIVMAAGWIRDLKCAFENMKFQDILKLHRMEDRLLCKCGEANFVHRVISSRCPFIFTISLEWVKDETEDEISETTKALDWEIDISRLYEGLEPNRRFRLSSVVGYSGEEEHHVCLVNKTNMWFSLRNEALSVEDADVDVVGEWENVVSFCTEKKVRLEILFYEDVS